LTPAVPVRSKVSSCPPSPRRSRIYIVEREPVMQARQATARSIRHPLPCTTTTVTLLRGQLSLSKSKLWALSRAGHDTIARYCCSPVSAFVICAYPCRVEAGARPEVVHTPTSDHVHHHRLRGFPRPSVADQHRGPLPAEATRNRPTQRPTSTRHQRNPPREPVTIIPGRFHH
jgi:hypothetical protein